MTKQKHYHRQALPFLIWVFGLLVPGVCSTAHSQEWPDLGSAVLGDYVQQGLDSNLELQKRHADYRLQLEALRQARAMFFPDIRFQSRYSVADGGRVIGLPLGDMLNPVYQTLNQLTGSSMFQPLENEAIPFLRPTEHETKVRLVQPLINTSVGRGYKIAKQQLEIESIALERYTRDLIVEIAHAYYDYLAMVSLEELVQSNQELVQENIRVNNALLANDKVTRDAVWRAEAEFQKIIQKQAEVRKGKEMTKAWFNFLLNQPLNSSILIDTIVSVPGVLPVERLTLEQGAQDHREEVQQMENAIQAGKLITELQKRNAIPDLSLVVDYGFLAEEISFSGDDDYVLASLVLQVPLYHGGENRSKIREASLQTEKLELQHKELKRQIVLDIRQAWYEYQAAVSAYQAVMLEEKASREAYRMIQRKYEEGQASQIELIDTRTAWFSADERRVQARYEVFKKYISIQRKSIQNFR